MSETTDLVVYREMPQSLTVVYQEPGGVDAVLALIERQAREEAAGLDVSRPKDREKMASLARTKIARSKTALLDADMKLTEEWRTATAKVNAEKRTITERLDALRDEIRQPLTDWENAEKARIAGHEDLIARINSLTEYAGRWQDEVAIQDINDRLAWLSTLDGRDWQEFKTRGALAITTATAALTKLRDDLIKREEDARELARLKAIEEDRLRIQREQEQRDHEARIAQEAAERAKHEAETRAAAEAARIAREAQEREAALERQRREAEDALKAVERRAKQAAEQAERDRVAAVEAERKRQADEAARLKREEDARAANRAHRQQINNEALAAIVLAMSGVHSGNADEAADIAKAIVTAIAKGEVPHVGIRY